MFSSVAILLSEYSGKMRCAVCHFRNKSLVKGPATNYVTLQDDEGTWTFLTRCGVCV